MARKPKWGARPSPSLGLGRPALPLSPEGLSLPVGHFSVPAEEWATGDERPSQHRPREGSRDAPVLLLPVTPSDGRPRLGFWQQHLVLPVLELSIDRRPGAHTPASVWLPGRRARGRRERCSSCPGTGTPAWEGRHGLSVLVSTARGPCVQAGC